MDKLSRSQLPDSSSSPPLSNIFHSFDDEAMSDLPSCIYASAHSHHHHHQHQMNHLPMSNVLTASSGLSPSPPPTNSNANNLRLSVNSFRQIQQHFMQSHGDISEMGPSLATSSSPSLHNFNNSPASSQAKNQRQQGSGGGGPIRERKRTLRSAPNGTINAAFDELRTHVPTFPYEKRQSKIDSLNLAIAYIALLREVLNTDYDPLTYVEKCLRGEIKAENSEWNTSDLTARLSWINWENLGVHPGRRLFLSSLATTENSNYFGHQV